MHGRHKKRKVLPLTTLLYLRFQEHLLQQKLLHPMHTAMVHGLDIFDFLVAEMPPQPKHYSLNGL